jgi:sugar lactone lactonase YvrE
VWDKRTGVLHWVDVSRGLLHAWPLRGSVHSVSLGPPLSCIVQHTAGGWVVARGGELFRSAPEAAPAAGALRPFARAPGDEVFNDGACDDRGQLWIGTTTADRRPGAGALYEVDGTGRLVERLAGVTMSNGLGWSPEGDRCYYVDSLARRVDAFDVHPGGGGLGGRQVLAHIAGDVLPDGLAVDAEGGVWVALWGAGRIHRYVPDGRLDTVVGVSAPRVTSCAFVGTTLYITTARGGPGGGALHAVEVGCTGRPVRPCGLRLWSTARAAGASWR